MTCTEESADLKRTPDNQIEDKANQAYCVQAKSVGRGKCPFSDVRVFLSKRNKNKYIEFLAVKAIRCILCFGLRSRLRLQNAWWRHQMEAFSALLALCTGNSPVTGEFPAKRPVTRSFDVFFDLRLNKRWSKKSWGWWFETPSRSLWRHCNGAMIWGLQWVLCPIPTTLTLVLLISFRYVSSSPLVWHICVGKLGQHWLGAKPLPEPTLDYGYL